MLNPGENNAESSFFQSEEITLDLLKNTPSNIAKLEDVIDHCKGRHKYLARTKSPSDGENVRWYFCKIPLAQEELAASVPKSEIVGKSDYFRFSVRDSLALEAFFLQKEEEILSHWWKEYAECSAGPSDSICPKVSSDDLYTDEEERVGVPVKGGLYEVDLIRRHCFPVYWSGENRRILRGHWFARNGGLDWLPLREDIAEPLEFAYQCQIWHRRTFQPSGLFAARVNIQGTSQGLHALFTGEDDTWEAWLVIDTSDFSLRMGRGNKFQLRRGFSSSGSLRPTQDELRQKKEEEMDDYCSQVPVRHVVFMVHGIGQRLLKANLVDDVGNFRHITTSLAERHLSPYQRSIQRVLYIPCQWRKGLKLSGESAVENITLDGVRGLRVTLSATVHDVLYYMSPIYCQDIINSVSNQLNKLYQKFLKRNPGYDGKISIYGHSLGSVLSYDILCHQENLTAPFHMISEHDIRDKDNQSRVDSDIHSQVSSCNQNTEHQTDKINDANTEHQTNTCSSMINPSVVDCEDSRDEKYVLTRSSTSSLLDEASSSNKGKHVSSISVLGEDGLDLECETYPELMIDEMDSTLTNASLYDDAQSAVRNNDDLDKDKLIALLKKEVIDLKESICKLKQVDKSTPTKMQIHCNFDSIKETKEVKAAGIQSLSTPDQDFLRKSYTPYINYTKLDFKVDTFFAVGSPLGVFLALRNMHIGIGNEFLKLKCLHSLEFVRIMCVECGTNQLLILLSVSNQYFLYRIKLLFS
ncbi:Membrane-associated phosphatidylinositol transfer protein 1 [Zostera marina]|uniref:Membrane-associated phosphatidylinositol transfer protein 1 n=1 Tax=Zostera marina TaxID=29655 RepID=A0A0K9NS74_ZOSMR|nr:Membrane-associated phosphatidylinositol transfer protein 1 [Zostera marina]